MYNLIVGFGGDMAMGSRMLEHTSPTVKEYLTPGGQLDPARLLNLPTLMMPEVGGDSQKVARVGYIENLTRRGKDYRFRFVPTSSVPAIPLTAIETNASELEIGSWELQRTHWAVKDVDLYRVLNQSIAPSPPPTVFRLPRELPQEDLVAVMMPFDTGYLSVYSALQEAVEAAGLRCQRVDDIWINPGIMDDVASLIWRAKVVVSDLSGKNPNVFYETGIAHALGRDVLPITRSADDVPFDLRHLRYVQYLPNAEGLDELKATVTKRLRDTTAVPA